ncbi:MAG: cytochrome c [Deltaproteobacteria bacterium]|nr:cytochrome c [Candidatus Anaeroferrophillacea bacterium]
MRLNTLPVFVFTFLLTMFAAGCGGPSAGDPENGARIYRRLRCAACHENRTAGSTVPDLSGFTLSFRRFRAILRKPSGAAMPAYGPERVADKEAADLHAWLRDRRRDP